MMPRASSKSSPLGNDVHYSSRLRNDLIAQSVIALDCYTDCPLQVRQSEQAVISAKVAPLVRSSKRLDAIVHCLSTQVEEMWNCQRLSARERVLMPDL